jgi:predicted kinase
MSRVIFVSGPPGAGKSTLARALEREFGWPLLAKDDYKEPVFRVLGARDRDWSRRVSALAWELLFAEAGRLVAHGRDCLLEGNFRAAQAPALLALAARGARLIELACTAEPAVLLARYRARAADGSRHPGHVDLEALPEVEREIRAPPPPLLAAGGARLVWDTSGGIETLGLADRLAALAGAGSGAAR